MEDGELAVSWVEIRVNGTQSVMRGKSNIIKTIMGLKSWVENQVMESKKRSSKMDK